MTQTEITVYGAHWCPDCRRSKQFLGEHQIPYAWVDIEQDKDAERLVIEKNDGKRIIPTITFADGSFLVAFLNDELVATGALVPEAEGTARIVRMSVAAGSRRRGIGTMMLQRLCERARNCGYRRIVLETTSTWDDAIAFYTELGFQLIGSREGDTHFVLDLAPPL